MYELIVKGHFSSAHRVRGYKGKCEHLHGHNWLVEVTLRKGSLDRLGMVMDFKDIKKILNDMLDGYDHKYLNELPDFKRVNPTTENIARLLAGKLQKQLKPTGVKVVRVNVWESEQSGACYVVR